MHNLFLVYFVNLYTFRASLGPSSGGKPYVYNSWYLLFFLDDRLLLYLPMMGVDSPETYRGWRNIGRISCLSTWFPLHNYIEMHGQKP